ncbi:ABC transporter permease [Chroogloeocystis siderophila]|jgi:ABC-2 type transport system permease protein|uniref:ABC transporter n=1 Tax=Chroogloeocystis siderophila 5.2 s.c.1 TaxID=247279 RepID=A0A1U7HBE6_9CHRO|nr:ABC transporter permease [Chroogloeocystis siderophila]OKH20871.1 ABC transporter [Chroogloeocystis siderophila 5.2 s.c.1]
MLELFLAELKRSWIEFTRYPVDAVAGVFIITSVFYGLFLSARYIAGPNLQFGDRLDAIVVGYVLWTLVIFVVTSIVSILQIEAQTGTLEQVMLTPYGVSRVFLARAIASLTINIVLITGILLLILLLTGRRLYFPLTLIFPLLTVLFGAYGLAFLMASLALLFKRIQQLLGLTQFALLFLLTIPSETWSGTLSIVRFLLPMTMGAGILRDLMARNLSLNFVEISLAFLNGLGYLFLGLIVFRRAEVEAKRRGILGGY